MDSGTLLLYWRLSCSLPLLLLASSRCKAQAMQRTNSTCNLRSNYSSPVHADLSRSNRMSGNSDGKGDETFSTLSVQSHSEVLLFELLVETNARLSREFGA